MAGEPSEGQQGDIKLLIDDLGDGKIAMIAMRNERGNCLNFRLLNKLAQIFREVSSDQRIRAVVLSGSGGRDFCSGADLQELQHLNAHNACRLIFAQHMACTTIQRCPFPVIARIQGACTGLGLQLALFCDLRIADQTAWFRVTELKMGLPFVSGASLGQLVGWGRAREMVMLGRRYRAEEAERIGLIERAVPPGEFEEVFGQTLLRLQGNGRSAIRLQKALFTRWGEAVEGNMDVGLWAFVQACVSGEHEQLIERVVRARQARTDDSQVAEHKLS